jgi:glutamine synthetase
MCLYIVTQASKQAGPVGSAWSVRDRHFYVRVCVSCDRVLRCSYMTVDYDLIC